MTLTQFQIKDGMVGREFKDDEHFWLTGVVMSNSPDLKAGDIIVTRGCINWEVLDVSIDQRSVIMGGVEEYRNMKEYTIRSIDLYTNDTINLLTLLNDLMNYNSYIVPEYLKC